MPELAIVGDISGRDGSAQHATAANRQENKAEHALAVRSLVSKIQWLMGDLHAAYLRR